jgi:predicted TIM-barrel fold metal-dependent hydrolase
MEGKTPSRRTLLKLGGAAVAGAVLGIGGWEAFRFLTGAGNPTGKTADAPERNVSPVKAVIDTHVHLVNTNLRGVPESSAPDGTPFRSPPEQLARAVQAQMKEANVEHALCMPRREHALCMPRREMDEKDPLGIEGTRRLAALVPGLHPIGLADPERFDDKHLERVEDSLKRGGVVALKAYLGYLHHGPESPGYRPYYRLAAKYNIPVIFHSGDTWSHLAKVKYAHPLHIDEVAVDFPETNFVIAHMGNPWLMDTAEVIYKNNKKGVKENVWADLSALVVGSADDFENYRKQGVLKTVSEDVRKAIEFAERPDRFLFGSDWPLAPMKVYRDFIRELVPGQYHQAVFYDNAKALFKVA